mmetsp:Transcript_115161/g.229378  ORF Transcript_115161/g.229378 Transcript_115161/m.229378 type:complete len:288 (+) Transcript_115161:59-922(+)
MLSADLEDRVARLEGDLARIKCHVSADNVLTGTCSRPQSVRRQQSGEAGEVGDHCHDRSRSHGRCRHAGSDELQRLEEQMLQRISAERIKRERWQVDTKAELERASAANSHNQMVMRKMVEAHGAFVEHVGSLETRFDELAPRFEELHQNMSRVEQPAHDLTGSVADRPDWENAALGQLQTMVAEMCSKLQEKLDVQMEAAVNEPTRLATFEARVEAAIGELTSELNVRLAALESRLGSAPVPELMSTVSEKLHGRINTLQAMMERRCSNVESQICAARPRRGGAEL